jgi:polyisoprenoid-binding protein YceI
MTRKSASWCALVACGCALLLDCMHSNAQSPSSAETAPANKSAFAPGDIDTNLSRIYVHVDKAGLGHEHGVEAKFKSGHLPLAANQNPGELVIDMASFSADTDEARRYVGLDGSTDQGTRKEVNKNMLGPDVLDVQKYPTAVFKVANIQQVKGKRPNAPPQIQLDGDFTLHGKTNKLSVVAESSRVSGYIRVYGNFSILQSDYGITPFSKAFGAIGVADRLSISGELWIVDQQGAAPVQRGAPR